MADATPPAGAGHNSGVLDLSLALDATQLRADLTADSVALLKRSEELTGAFTRFEKATAAGITTEEMAGKAGDFVRQLAAAVKVIDDRRTVVKAPVLAAQRQIDAYYKGGMSDLLDAMKAKVLGKITAYQRAEQAKADEARRAEAARAREEAARQEALAEAARTAEEADTAMVRAVEAEETAQALAAPSTAPAPIMRSDMGTSVGMRKGPWQVRVVDITKVPAQFLMVNNPVLLATAKTDPRITAGEQPIPGVEFFRDTVANVR